MADLPSSVPLPQAQAPPSSSAQGPAHLDTATAEFRALIAGGPPAGAAAAPGAGLASLSADDVLALLDVVRKVAELIRRVRGS